MISRKPAVEGSFYPSDFDEVTEMINSFDSKINVNVEDIQRPKILISPHAGLFFSGLTATYGYKLASKYKYDRIVIFAPSHRVYFDGMSGAMYENYFINGMKLAIDRKFTGLISEKFNLRFIEKAHAEEHSAEIQLPFVSHYFPGVKLSIFVYASFDSKKLSEIINYILNNHKETLIIISSDLSHFHSYDVCNKIDGNLIVGIKELDVLKISQNEACGMVGITAAIESANKNNLTPKILDYRNSGDIIPDKNSAVGYVSVALI